MKLRFTKKEWGMRLILLLLAGVMILISPFKVDGQTQTASLRGMVTSADGVPIIGATIVVKGTTSGASTDMEGKFSIKHPSANSVLLVSYIGCEPAEVKVEPSQTFIVIKLDEKVNELEDVQVIAYGSQKKITVTGAIASIGSKELLKSPVGSISNALTGKLPGLTTVQYSGQPGADNATLFVRGIGTTNNSQPLFLVDGVERSFFQLDPNEIEDITVLKDASATAVYGVRGANGVIIATTKRGEKGKTKVSLSTSMGVQAPTRLPKFVNSYDWATYYNEAVLSDNPNADPVFGTDIMTAFKTGSDPLIYPNIDWINYVTKPAAIQSQHNISISGGMDRVRYFVSLGAYTQDGLIKDFGEGYNSNFEYRRYNFRSNIDFDITKSTLLSLTMGGRVEDRNQPQAGTGLNIDEIFRFIYRALPFGGAGVVNGNRIVSNPAYYPISMSGGDGLQAFYGTGYTSSIWNVLNVDANIKQKLDVVTKGLNFRIKGSYNSQYSQTKQRSKTSPTYIPIKQDDGSVALSINGDDTELGFNESYTSNRGWYAEAALDYQRTFGLHNVTGLILYNQSKSYYPETNADIPSGYVGLVGRVTYNFNTKYLVDFNIGYNGSENFHRDNRYGIFPAVSAGYVVSQEKFFKRQNIVSYLKFRASYGVVGSDQMGGSRFMYLPGTYSFGAGGAYNFNFPFGTNTANIPGGVYEATAGNPLVTWEKAFKQNYGFDVSFLKERLKVNFDYFSDHREDILSTDVTPGIYGGKLEKVNFGVVDNSGYEISVTWTDKVNHDFRYTISANIGYAKNKRVVMDEAIQPYANLVRTGTSVGQPFVRQFWGFYDEGSNERYKQQYGTDIADHGRALTPGDCVYVDVNKDGSINDNDIQAMGFTNNPEYSGGITLALTYKNFDFSMLWNGATNASRGVSESFRMPMGEKNDYSILSDHFTGRWTPETASTAKYPRATLANRKNNYEDSSLWLLDASYLRLKNVEISYRFDGEFVKKLGMRSFMVFANGNNLLTFDKLKILDPETRTDNRPTYPAMRVMNLGVRVDF